jgi:alanyl-tRNA synthetase
VSELLRVPSDQAGERIEKLLDERKATEKQLADLKRKSALGGNAAAESGAGEVSGSAGSAPALAGRKIAGIDVYVKNVPGFNPGELRGLVDDLRGQVKSGVVLVTSAEDGKVSLALGVTPDLKDKLKAGDLVREVSAVLGGKGGGRPDFAQGGGSDASKLAAAIDKLYELIGGASA